MGKKDSGSNTDDASGSLRNRADYLTAKTKQQLNKCCFPGAFGAEPRINDPTSKPLTSPISLQTPHQPTHPNNRPMKQKHCAPH